MNEKIRDLAISSGIYDSITDPYDKHKTGDHYGSVMDDLERFAELIVRECIDVFIKRQTLKDGGPAVGYYEPDEPAEIIKKHFGVEE